MVAIKRGRLGDGLLIVVEQRPKLSFFCAKIQFDLVAFSFVDFYRGWTNFLVHSHILTCTRYDLMEE